MFHWPIAIIFNSNECVTVLNTLTAITSCRCVDVLESLNPLRADWCKICIQKEKLFTIEPRGMLFKRTRTENYSPFCAKPRMTSLSANVDCIHSFLYWKQNIALSIFLITLPFSLSMPLYVARFHTWLIQKLAAGRNILHGCHCSNIMVYLPWT